LVQTEHLSITNTKVGSKEVRFRQVTLFMQIRQYIFSFVLMTIFTEG